MHKNKLIFIVDDDQFINMLVVKRLSAEGYKVEAFESGEDCLDAISQKPNLIILDYYFDNEEREVMNGTEIFNKIKEFKPDIPVIILSGQDKGEVVLELARKGIDDYVIKDNNVIDNLLGAITELFGRRK